MNKLKKIFAVFLLIFSLFTIISNVNIKAAVVNDSEMSKTDVDPYYEKVYRNEVYMRASKDKVYTLKKDNTTYTYRYECHRSYRQNGKVLCESYIDKGGEVLDLWYNSANDVNSIINYLKYKGYVIQKTYYTDKYGRKVYSDYGIDGMDFIEKLYGWRYVWNAWHWVDKGYVTKETISRPFEGISHNKLIRKGSYSGLWQERGYTARRGMAPNTRFKGKNYLVDWNFNIVRGIFNCSTMKGVYCIHGSDKNGVMLTGKRKINNRWYYFDRDGFAKTGWFKIGRRWYWANTRGAIYTNTGWKKRNNRWMYNSGVNGYYASENANIRGRTYSFDRNGYRY